MLTSILSSLIYCMLSSVSKSQVVCLFISFIIPFILLLFSPIYTSTRRFIVSLSICAPSYRISSINKSIPNKRFSRIFFVYSFWMNVFLVFSAARWRASSINELMPFSHLNEFFIDCWASIDPSGKDKTKSKTRTSQLNQIIRCCSAFHFHRKCINSQSNCQGIPNRMMRHLDFLWISLFIKWIVLSWFFMNFIAMAMIMMEYDGKIFNVRYFDVWCLIHTYRQHIKLLSARTANHRAYFYDQHTFQVIVIV